MSMQQERIPLAMRVLFTLFALDVCVVAVLVRAHARTAVSTTAGFYFECSLAIAGAAILATVARIWWRPTRRPRTLRGAAASRSRPQAS